MIGEWKRRLVDHVKLDLPYPPSVNSLYTRGPRGVYRRPRYVSWLNEAGKHINAQRPGRVSGPYSLLVAVQKKSGRRDIDNLVKAVSDVLVENGVIYDDQHAESVTALWADNVAGCRVVITAVRKQARAA